MSNERSRTSQINGRFRPDWSPEARRGRCSLAVVAVLLGIASAAAAQTSFLEVTPPADPYFVTPPEEDFWVNAVAPADVDGDGDLDSAAIGFYVVYNVSAEDRLVLFINDGPDPGGGWLFSHQLLPLGSLSAGASDLAWADFDGDADYDLAVGSDGATVIYRNDAGVLMPLDGALPGYWEDSGYTGAYDLRSLTWADADNDGDQDLLIPSVFDPDTSSMRTVLMRNDGGPINVFVVSQTLKRDFFHGLLAGLTAILLDVTFCFVALAGFFQIKVNLPPYATSVLKVVAAVNILGLSAKLIRDSKTFSFPREGDKIPSAAPKPILGVLALYLSNPTLYMYWIAVAGTVTGHRLVRYGAWTAVAFSAAVGAGSALNLNGAFVGFTAPTTLSDSMTLVAGGSTPITTAIFLCRAQWSSPPLSFLGRDPTSIHRQMRCCVGCMKASGPLEPNVLC